MNRRFSNTSDLLAEAQNLNWQVAERRSALETRERELTAELECVRAALAMLPMPSATVVPVWSNEHRMMLGNALLEIDGAAPDADESATEGVLRILSESMEPMTAFEVIERIVVTGRHWTPGVVHSALSRLNSRGEIQSFGERGERRYLANTVSRARILGRRLGALAITDSSSRGLETARKRNR